MRLLAIPGPFDARALRRKRAADHHRHRSASAGRQGFVRAGNVVSALQTSNVILPAGDAPHRQHRLQRATQLQSGHRARQLRPIQQSRRFGDRAARRRGQSGRRLLAEQRGIVHVNGKRAAFWRVLFKHSDASTLAVVEATRDSIPIIRGLRATGDGSEDRLRSICFCARGRWLPGSGARGRAFVDPGLADDSGVSGGPGAA